MANQSTANFTDKSEPKISQILPRTAILEIQQDNIADQYTSKLIDGHNSEPKILQQQPGTTILDNQKGNVAGQSAPEPKTLQIQIRTTISDILHDSIANQSATKLIEDHQSEPKIFQKQARSKLPENNYGTISENQSAAKIIEEHHSEPKILQKQARTTIRQDNQIENPALYASPRRTSQEKGKSVRLSVESSRRPIMESLQTGIASPKFKKSPAGRFPLLIATSIDHLSGLTRNLTSPGSNDSPRHTYRNRGKVVQSARVTQSSGHNDSIFNFSEEDKRRSNSLLNYDSEEYIDKPTNAKQQLFKNLNEDTTLTKKSTEIIVGTSKKSTGTGVNEVTLKFSALRSTGRLQSIVEPREIPVKTDAAERGVLTKSGNLLEEEISPVKESVRDRIKRIDTLRK